MKKTIFLLSILSLLVSAYSCQFASDNNFVKFDTDFIYSHLNDSIVISFKNENFDSLPYLVEAYENLYYRTIFPELRKSFTENDIREICLQLGADKSDIGYIFIGLIHKNLNKASLDYSEILIMAKELKYRDYLYHIKQTKLLEEEHFSIAKSNAVNIGDTIELILLVEKETFSDTLKVVGFHWMEDIKNDKSYNKLRVKALVIEAFQSHKYDFATHCNILILDTDEKYFDFYDITYSVGSKFSLDLMKYGRNIKVL